MSLLIVVENKSQHPVLLSSLCMYMYVFSPTPFTSLCSPSPPASLCEQANATGRSAKSVREFLEKQHSPEAVRCRDDAVMLAIKALLEVVQSGSKSMELAVMERGKKLEVRLRSSP